MNEQHSDKAKTMENNMIWKTEFETFLIQRNMKKIFNYAIRLQSNEYIVESGEFFAIDNKGSIRDEYQAAEYSCFDFEIRISHVHVVIENELYRLRKSYFPDRMEITETKLLKNLQPYKGDLPFNLKSALDAFEISKKENYLRLQGLILTEPVYRRFINTNKVKIWKTADGTFLIQRNMRKIPLLLEETIGLENNEQFNESAEYFEVTNEGIILKTHNKAKADTNEYDLSIVDIHRVIGDSLYRFFTKYDSSSVISVTTSNIKLLSGLQPHDGDLLFDLALIINTFENLKK